MSTSIVPTTGRQGSSDTGSSVQGSPSSPPASSSPAASITTTGGQRGNDPSAGLAAGVAVGVVLAVVVVVVVVVAVLLAVCSIRRRRKYDLGCNGTYEVPYDAYIGKFISTQFFF